jgi:hypothetical protein
VIRQPIQAVFIFWGISAGVHKRPKLGDSHRIARDVIARQG